MEIFHWRVNIAFPKPSFNVPKRIFADSAKVRLGTLRISDILSVPDNLKIEIYAVVKTDNHPPGQIPEYVPVFILTSAVVCMKCEMFLTGCTISSSPQPV